MENKVGFMKRIKVKNYKLQSLITESPTTPDPDADIMLIGRLTDDQTVLDEVIPRRNLKP